VIEEVIVPEPVKAAPQDWRRIGEEVSERLDYEPARFLRRRTVRPKYVQRGVLDAVPIVAPLPEGLLERSLVAPGLLAQIVVSKYCDHLPLYRQESIYWTRHQVWLPRQTMAEWVGLAAEWLTPIYHQIRADILEHGYVQVDETPIRYLAPGHGRTKLGYLWACGVPRGDVLFHWEASRAASCLDNIIPRGL
jgi:transposase